MGEQPRNIGNEAEAILRNFIRSLSYIIYDWNNEEYDIDGIAQIPEENHVLLRPSQSPNGLTAFEITSSIAVGKSLQ